jgi:hypothetical protein
MIDIIKLTISGVTTSTSAPSTATSLDVNGYIEAVMIDVSGTTPDMDLDIVTVADADGISQTIFSADDVTADATHYPRRLLQTTAGANIDATYGKIAVANQKIQLQASDAGDAGAENVTVYILVSQEG